MKRIFAIAVVALVMAPADLVAQERATDAALGAVAGAVVFGPVGALAGAAVGYTAGPAISRGFSPRPRSYRQVRYVRHHRPVTR